MLEPLPKLAEKLLTQTKNLLLKINTTQDLKIGFEKLLEPIKAELNIESFPLYEKSIYKGRLDALHGQVIIEYEPPSSLRSTKNINHALEQLLNYLSNEEKDNTTQLIGIAFDGERIFFVKKKNEKWTKEPETDTYEFNSETARTFLIHLRALSRLPLNPENLTQKFSPQTELASKMILALTNALEHWGNQTHIHTYFNEWKRLFGIVYGQTLNTHSTKETESLSKFYKTSKQINFQELLFCIHTYFTFLMKLIAVEILTLRETAFHSSFASSLVHVSDEELKRQLEDIENGGVFTRKGITNFLEGDFFRWYLDALDSPQLKEAIREVARAISEFEPATSTLEPKSTRDLLKKLYQYLVPQEVRHRLGEYYTPDWLAELLLEELEYDGNNFQRLLDPACGSGTFLVFAIQKAKEWGIKNKRPALEIVKSIKANIWGFDLNPLAVIASRTNYIFALGDLANEILERGGTIEIPVYLTDSVLTPTQTTGNLFGEFLEVSTSVGNFKVPAEWVRDSFLLARAVPLLEEMVKNEYSTMEAIKRLKKEGLVFPSSEQTTKELYTQILELERENKNGIWARFLKNVFAPVVAGQFDFIVGNPPWILWEYLSKEYREATKTLWEEYGLTQIDKGRNVLARARKDFSSLFVYASSDSYLRDGGKLGFLITQEVFKSKGAGEGFRRFQLGNKKYLKVLKAHDLASLQPFEGATNKTAFIILKKGEKTKYPVPYFVWSKKKGVGKISTDQSLGEVLSLLQKKKYTAEPMGSDIGAWKTQTKGSQAHIVIEGKNHYKATIGANTDPYGVFWLEIKTVLSNGNLLIRNLAEWGKTKIPLIEKKIEADLVYPALRGADIEKWSINCKIYALITHPHSQVPYNIEIMKKNWPYTFAYLTEFKEILMNASLYRHFHKKAGNAFYGQRNINQDTFSNYKVVWRIMATDLIACVISQLKTPFGYKVLIPFKTLALIPSSQESEAHY
ncbi:MAG: N-6 DNA methylase, partial [Leptospiraceae bacterium]|nr:N-6 DNA methylase [Leptospiraceae bacterium]